MSWKDVGAIILIAIGLAVAGAAALGLIWWACSVHNCGI